MVACRSIRNYATIFGSASENGIESVLHSEGVTFRSCGKELESKFVVNSNYICLLGVQKSVKPAYICNRKSGTLCRVCVFCEKTPRAAEIHIRLWSVSYLPLTITQKTLY